MQIHNLACSATLWSEHKPAGLRAVDPSVSLEGVTTVQTRCEDFPGTE